MPIDPSFALGGPEWQIGGVGNVGGADRSRLHETEIEHLDEVLSTPDPPDVDVGGLDVAVDEASCVRFLE